MSKNAKTHIMETISWILQIINVFVNLYNTSQICAYSALHDKIIVPHSLILHNTSQVHGYITLHDETIH
jgi:hypothetical protein